MSEAINLTDIRIDGGTQSRVELNNGVVAEYSTLMREGVSFPPITLFFDGSHYWLSDGFHRLHAARAAARASIDADVTLGTKRDALLASLGANSAHGLPRTNADKRRAVDLLLRDPEWSQWSDREIARRASVGHSLVSDMRANLSVRYGQINEPPRTVRRGETTYTMQPRTADVAPERVDMPQEAAPRTSHAAEPLPESVALRYSSEAIGLLGRIPPGDRLRGEALDDVLRWINFNR